MTIVAAIEAVTIVVVVFLMLRHQGAQERLWGEERRELLNRVQRPDYAPQTVAESFAFPDPEPDELALVGTIAEPKVDE